jgi:cell division septum initiation protein DivIVA
MRLIPILLAALSVLSVAHRPTHGGEIPAAYKPAIQNGLAWLVKQQNKDGSWSARDKESDVSCTALAGLALLMEGSTAANGRYAGNVNKAVDWMVRNCQTAADDGFIGARERLDRTSYMFGQSYALLFLASAYAREVKTDAKDFSARLARVRQREMEEVLQRAVQFSAKAQSSTGGWYFTSCQDGHDEDEASATLAQLLALRAAQQAGIKLPKETLTKAFAYLERITTPSGGIPLSSRSAGKVGAERPGFTIAAFASTLGSKRANPVLAKKWLGYSQ